MNERVVDASALVYALIGTSDDAVGLRQLLRRSRCHAPHLIDAELGSVLRRRTLTGALTPQTARAALDAAPDVIEVRHAHTGTLSALAWSLRDNLSFYDALYVALAARLGVPLLTGDVRLSRAPRLPCEVQTV